MHANKYFIESVKHAAEALEDQATSLSKEPEFVLQNTVGTAVREANELVCYQKAIDVLEAKYDDARSLLDGAYEVVELFNPQTPSQVEWKQQWLEGAMRHGASSF